MIKARSVCTVGAALALAVALWPSGVTGGGVQAPSGGAEVRLTLTITDRHGRYVSALGRERVTVLEENVPVEVTSFEQSDRPASIGVVVDMSRDGRPRLLASAKTALSNFVRNSEKDHRYFVMGFDADAYLAADWAGSPAEVAAGFDRLAGVKPSKKTALYDAVRAALTKVRGGPHTKRAVILISDGRSDGSRLKREELFEAVRRSDALLYAVSFDPREGKLTDLTDHTLLNKLCSMSGGFASSAETEADFQTFFERVSVELDHQYAVGFVPGGGPAGWRRLSFKAKTLELKKSPSSKDVEKLQLHVRGREGYYHGR